MNIAVVEVQKAGFYKLLFSCILELLHIRFFAAIRLSRSWQLVTFECGLENREFARFYLTIAESRCNLHKKSVFDCLLRCCTQSIKHRAMAAHERRLQAIYDALDNRQPKVAHQVNN